MNYRKLYHKAHKVKKSLPPHLWKNVHKAVLKGLMRGLKLTPGFLRRLPRTA